MKKILTVLSIVLVISLCACGEKASDNESLNNSEEVISNENEVLSEDINLEETDAIRFEELLKKDYSDVPLKVKNSDTRELVDYDYNYAKEYYKVIRSYNEGEFEEIYLEFATIPNEGKFPTLVMKNEEEYSAWKYENGAVSKLSEEELANVDFSSLYFTEKYGALQIFENALYDANTIYEDIKEYKNSNIDLSEYLSNRVSGEEINYGSSYEATEEDGKEKSISTMVEKEGNDLFITIEHSEIPNNKKIKIEGLEADSVINGFVVTKYGNFEVPKEIFELTTSGEIYKIEIPTDAETTMATKVDNLSNVFEIGALEVYPCRLPKFYDEQISYEVAVTTNGEVVSLYE